MPNLTTQQYVNQAKAFAAEQGRFNEAIIGNKFFLRHDPATGRFFSANIKTNEIRTYFVDDGRVGSAFWQDRIESSISKL